MNDYYTHFDEIDQFLFDLVHVLPGCCSSIENTKYTISRKVAEALWSEKDFALTEEDIQVIVNIDQDLNNEEATIGPVRKNKEHYEEVLKRYQEYKGKNK